MKLFLASFLQKENFGSGDIISICSGTKPKDIEVKKQFIHFIPSENLINEYYNLRQKDQNAASDFFVSGYQKQLEEVITSVTEEASMEKLSVLDILPFKDGDTLCSWERGQFNNYRKILAPYLEKLGYEVVLN